MTIDHQLKTVVQEEVPCRQLAHRWVIEIHLAMKSKEDLQYEVTQGITKVKATTAKFRNNRRRRIIFCRRFSISTVIRSTQKRFIRKRVALT